MSNVITVGQLIMDAQRMASRVKDLDALGSALLVEAEGNNRLVESLRQFQDDVDSLNRISNNKSNAEMVNRIQQQNANSSEILKENRELKVCIEDYERAMEMIMQKYREHTGSKVLDSKINFKDVYNEKLWKIIREQREKINEMAAVMQRAASADDDAIDRDLEVVSRLRLENKTLRELLQISKQFGTYSRPIRINEFMLEEKGVQTEGDDSADELSLSGASVENANNNTVIQLNNNSGNAAVLNATATATATATDNAPEFVSGAAVDNNNGPTAAAAAANATAANSTSNVASTRKEVTKNSTDTPSNITATLNSTTTTTATANASTTITGSSVSGGTGGIAIVAAGEPNQITTTSAT